MSVNAYGYDYVSKCMWVRCVEVHVCMHARAPSAVYIQLQILIYLLTHIYTHTHTHTHAYLLVGGCPVHIHHRAGVRSVHVGDGGGFHGGHFFVLVVVDHPSAL
jgi:hypothetical protein